VDRRYSSYSFSTSALDGGEWSASRPGRALHPGKGPLVPIVQEAGWASEPDLLIPRTPVFIQTIKRSSNASDGSLLFRGTCVYTRKGSVR
jgi:hypothetical protein